MPSISKKELKMYNKMELKSALSLLMVNETQTNIKK